MAGTTGNAHGTRILARATHSPKIHFLLPTSGNYYLFDPEFAFLPGYMSPIKGLDILSHFQQFHNERTWRRRSRFRNALERFNFEHSYYKNFIECAFGVRK